MAQGVLNVRMAKAFLFVDFNSKTGLITDFYAAVFIYKIFFGYVFSHSTSEYTISRIQKLGQQAASGKVAAFAMGPA